MSEVSTTLPLDAANEIPLMNTIEVMQIPTSVAEIRFGIESKDCGRGSRESASMAARREEEKRRVE